MFKKSFLNSSKKFLSPILKDKKILFSTIIFFFSDAIISIILIYLFKIILDNTGNINIISRDFYIFLFFVLYLFIKGFANGQLTVGELMILVSFIALLEGILKTLQELYFSFNKNMVDIVKIWDFFDNENKKIVSYDTGDNFIFKSGNISIKDLTFSYGDNDIFKNLDLEISGSKKIAFVGNSGAGKTTLLKLISGFISPNSGEIFIDGQNLTSVNLVSYYKNIGYLTQDPSVFDGTILENLMYGVDSSLLTPIPSPSYPQGASMVHPEEEGDEKNPPSPGRGGIEGGVLHEIIKLSKCDFIYDFKDGLNTEIGERGIRLSGGQKQRLAIAKIMLKNPHIILLDEPTSALDSFSEEQITIALNNLFLGKTVIIIAHRLQTVKNADEIILLENGLVKERGNHNELLEKKGDYFKMVELQSGF